MPDIELKKYSPVNPVLKKLVKYYWVLKSNLETEISGKLIPVNNIDLIINLSSPIKYINNTQEESFPDTHFTGIQSDYRVVKQSGMLDIIGISFYPAGFYPLIKVPLNEFLNKIVPIDSILQSFKKDVERISALKTTHERISMVEEILMNLIDLNLVPEKKYDLLINDFLMYGDYINIKNYCKNYGVNQKTLERFFYKHVGANPKSFLKVTKFQRTINSLMIGNFDSMTQIGYEFNYYDQTHFINSFKSFTGKTPAKQLKDNDLILDFLLKR